MTYNGKKTLALIGFGIAVIGLYMITKPYSIRRGIGFISLGILLAGIALLVPQTTT